MDRQAFDKKIEFDVNLIEYKGDDSWVENTLHEIKKCLDGTIMPPAGARCDWCLYWNARKNFEKSFSH